jgi:hypothetical protein
MTQPVLRSCLILDQHTVLTKVGNLLLIGERWLGIRACHSAAIGSGRQTKKDPPSVHILTDLGLAGAIALHIEVRVLQFNVE